MMNNTRKRMTLKQSWALAKQRSQALKGCPDPLELKALRKTAGAEWVIMEVIGKRQLTRYLTRGWELVTPEVSLFNASHRYLVRKNADQLRLDMVGHALV